MESTAQLIAQAIQTLQPETGFQDPNRHQLDRADVLAKVATAQALDSIATALTRLAENTAH